MNKYGLTLNIGTPYYKMTSSNEIECTTVQPSTATASSSVKCLYFGGDTSFGTAKKAVNGAGAGFI